MEGEEVLVIEPAAVVAQGNSTGAAVQTQETFHGITIGKGTAVELVLGNVHHDKAQEPQQSLFSWAEFMAEEPVKPRGHTRKP